MKKKLVSLIMVLAMLMSFVPIVASAATSGQCGDNLTWTLDDAGTLTISGTGDMWNWDFTQSPWYNNSNIKEVIIRKSYESNVTSIGSTAFFLCRNLTRVTIPNSVTSMAEVRFMIAQA